MSTQGKKMQTMSPDYYEILGIEKTATQDEIKKAYRKLAMKLHPDTNKEDPDAARKFAEAQEAYNILSDSQKRMKYDQFGKAGVDGNDPFSYYAKSRSSDPYGFAFDMNDIFNRFHNDNAGPTRPRPKNGQNILYKTKIALEDIMTQYELELEYEKNVKCSKCGGSGAESKKSCGMCGGSGSVRRSSGFFSVGTPCPQCKGTGEIIEKACSQCGGSRVEKKKTKIRIKLDSRVRDGSRLRMPGAGHEGFNGGKTGDIFVEFEVQDDPFFKRMADSDIISADLMVPLTTAMFGGHAEFEHLDGNRIRVKVPAGTKSGDTLEIKGAGLPNERGKRGKLILFIGIATPQNITKEQKKQLEEIFKDTETHLSQQK